MEVKAESSYEDSRLSYQWYKDDEKIKGAHTIFIYSN